ncbi:MAG: DUF4244 domain-containing protein [Actinomycetales bacterium]|nr:DUF4244 domain-containing protein [Actinomycetales bacterium]
MKLTSMDYARNEKSRLWSAIRDDTGSATAEYAIATMAAVGFAGMLVVILRGDEVRTILTDLVRRALTFAG